MFIRQKCFNDLVHRVNDLAAQVRDQKTYRKYADIALRKATTLTVPVVDKDGKPTNYYDFDHPRKRRANIQLTDVVLALVKDAGNEIVQRDEEPARLELRAIEVDDD